MGRKIDRLKADDSFSVQKFIRLKDKIAVGSRDHVDLAGEILNVDANKLTYGEMTDLIRKTDPLAGAGKLRRLTKNEGTVVRFGDRSGTLNIPWPYLEPKELEEIRIRDQKALEEAFPDEIFVRGSI